MDHRRFRPSFDGLEPRLAMSHAPAAVPTPVDPAFAATGHYPDAYRQGYHSYYLSEVAQGHAPALFLGDSITLAWNAPTGHPQGEPVWKATFAPLGAENFGVAGDQTQNLLYRIEDGELAGKPKVAVVLIGLNDLIYQSKAPAAVAAGVADVVAEIRRQSPRTQVLLLGLTPTDASPALSAAEVQVSNRLARVGHQKGVTYLDPGRAFYRADGALIPGVLQDVFHPSALGFQILASQLIGPVKAALRR